jgi:hypothetical protein
LVGEVRVLTSTGLLQFHTRAIPTSMTPIRASPIFGPDRSGSRHRSRDDVLVSDEDRWLEL